MVQNGSGDFGHREGGRIVLRFRTDPVNFGHQEGGRIASSLDFKSKRDPKTSLSLYCGLQVVVDDDDVSDRKIRV